LTGVSAEQSLDRSERLTAMIILGIILLIAGFLLKISILWTIGIILLIIGVVLALLGSTGRAVGGRRHYF
jgi:membrane-bound ClpP family serine protease